MPTDGLMYTESEVYLYIIFSVLRQIYSPFRSKFSRLCDPVHPLQVPVPIFSFKKLIPNLTDMDGVKYICLCGYLSTTKQDVALGNGGIFPRILTSATNGYLTLGKDAVVPIRQETE